MASTDVLISQIKTNPSRVIPLLTIEQMYSLIREADKKYYNEDRNIFSDDVYDQIRERLESLVGSVPYYRTPVSGRVVKLPFYMGSMNKVKLGEGTLGNWTLRYPGPYVVSIKLDGASALYTKSRGEFKLYSRGKDGIGQDISYLLTHLKLPNLPPDILAVRGELVIPKAIFESKRFLRPNTGIMQQDGTVTNGEYYENTRNSVSGLVNRKEGNSYNKELADALDFVVYESITASSMQPALSSQLQSLTSLGFQVVYHQLYSNVDEELLSQMIDSVLLTNPYALDGLIVHIDRPYQRNISGNPDYAVAFKKILLVKETRIRKIQWNTGKDEILTPVAILDPVDFDVTVSQVTLHNARRVVAGVLGPGAIIKIIRSGEVIPHVYEVVEPATSGEPALPTFPYIWTASGADIKLPEYDENQSEELADLRSDAKISRIYYFLSTLGVEKTGKKTVAQIYNAIQTEKGGGEPTLNDFLRLNVSQIRFLGPKTSETVIANIHRAIRRANPNKLVAASGLFGRGIGEKKMEMITSQLPDFWTRYPIPFQVDQITRDLMGVSGVATTTAELISGNYEKFYRFFLSIQDLLDPLVLQTTSVPAIFTLDRLTQISGLFTDFTPLELEQLLSEKVATIHMVNDVTSITLERRNRFHQLWSTFSNWVDQLEAHYGNLISRTVNQNICQRLQNELTQTVTVFPTIPSTSISGLVNGPTYLNPMPGLVVLSDFKGKKKYEEMIEARGGRIANTVTNATNIVVIGDETVQSGKRKKAEEKGIPVVTLEAFIHDYLTPISDSTPVRSVTGPNITTPTVTVTPIGSVSTTHPLNIATDTPTTTINPTVQSVTHSKSIQVAPVESSSSLVILNVLSTSFTLGELELLLSLEKSTPRRDELVKQMHHVLRNFNLGPKDKHQAVRKALQRKLELLTLTRQSFSNSEIRILLGSVQSPERSRLLERMNLIFTKDLVSGGRQKAELLNRVMSL